MELLDESSVKIAINIIGTIMTVITTIVAIFSYKNNSYNKKILQDFEQANKYFSKKNIQIIESEHRILKDMACNTISYFKGKRFEVIKDIIESEISLLEFSRLESLRKAGYIDEKYNLLNKYRETKKIKTIKYICYFLLILYLIIISIISVYFKLIGTPLGFIILITSISIIEIPILKYIENREILEWFKENGNSLKKYNSIIQLT